MDETSSRHESKFDTLKLLAGLSEADAEDFSIDDILKEYGGSEKNGEPDRSGNGAEAQPFSAKAENGNGKKAEPAKEDEFVSEIQKAIEREMELKDAVPAPVIRIDDVQKPAAVTDASTAAYRAATQRGKPVGDNTEELSEADRLLREHGIRLVQHTGELPEENVNKKAQEPEQDNEETVPDKVPDSGIHVTIREVKENPAEETSQHPKRPARKRSRLKLVQDESVPEPDEVYKDAGIAMRRQNTALTLSIVVSLSLAIWTVISIFGWSDAALFSNASNSSRGMALLLLCSAILAGNTIKSGFKNLMALRFNGEAMLLLTVVVTLLALISCSAGGRIPAAAPVSVALTFSIWNSFLTASARRKATRNLMKQDKKQYAFSVCPDAADGKSAAVPDSFSAKEHISGLLSDDYSEILRIRYEFSILLLSLIFAVITSIIAEFSFLWCLSAFLALAVPTSCWIAYSRPFEEFSGYLAKRGIALSGWTGVQALAECDNIRVCDDDLFPEGKVTLGGVKLYRSIDMSLAAAYASAVMEYSRSGLRKLFRALADANRAPELRVAQFHAYEGGGFGAEVTGDIILLGSRRFMQLMGIRGLGGTDIKNAVYMSVNGKLSAVFVMNYSVQERLRKALLRFMKNTGHGLLFATRDFTLTPLFVDRQFRIPMERVTFPNVELRGKLAELPGTSQHIHAAVTENNSMLVRAELMTRTTRLCGIITAAGISSMLMNCASLLVLFLLLILGTSVSVTAFTVLLLQLITAIPGIILTSRR